jgi:sialic acid synthase SpsE
MVERTKIGTRYISDADPTFLIAETAAGHMGNLDIAKQLIEIASMTKCDAIKFHIEDADETIVPSHEVYQLSKELEFEEIEWKELFQLSKENNLLTISMTNDLPSVRLAAACGTDAYYVHPGNIVDHTLIRTISKQRKTVFIGTGASTLDEIGDAVRLVREVEGNVNLVLMYGYQAYPTRIEDNNLRFIQTLARLFQVNVGFADHTDGESHLSVAVPILAIALGATVIEKHFTVDRKMKLIDYESAMNPTELSELVKQVRALEPALGSSIPHAFSKKEIDYRILVRKNVVANRPIAAGEIIDESMIAFKRSSPGISPRKAWRLLGRRARRDIRKDEVLSWNLLE